MSSAPPSDGELARRWAAVHPGMSASTPLVRGWLRLMWALASPLAARSVPPNAVTAAGALLGPLAVAAALGPPRWLAVLVLVLILAGAVADGLDGAVAILADRVSRFGARLDRWADRIVDSSWALVLWAFGAPWWAALLLIGATLAQEASRGDYARGLITVCERPTRLICTALAALCAALAPTATWTASVCAAVWGAAAAVALAQLALRARRQG